MPTAVPLRVSVEEGQQRSCVEEGKSTGVATPVLTSGTMGLTSGTSRMGLRFGRGA